jgi:hypothetical protein
MTRSAWLAAGALAIALVVGYGAVVRADFYRQTDFRCLWGGARAVLEHADPYDRSSWEHIVGTPTEEVNGQVVRICPDRFRYPLWTAVLLAPLGALQLEGAAVVWGVLNMAAVLFGIGWVWRVARGTTGGPLLAAIVLTSQPFWLLLSNGQLGGLVFGAVALELWLADRGRLAWAGGVLALLAAKPQLVALYLPARVVRAVASRQWRYLLAATAVGLALVISSVTLLPSWPGSWLGDVFGDRAGIHQQLATVWDLAGSLGGGAWLAGLLLLGVVATVVLVVGRRPVSAPQLAGLAIAVSVFAAPYAWSYDYLVLAVPWAVTIANADRAAASTQLRLALVVIASLLPWALYAAAFQRGDESLSAIVPAAAAILLAVSIRAGARGQTRTQLPFG